MLHVSVAEKHAAYLVFVDIAVHSGTAVERVFREVNVRHLFQKPNANNGGAFDANLVGHKTCVEQAQKSCVVDCPSRGTWTFVEAEDFGGELDSVAGMLYIHPRT